MTWTQRSIRQAAAELIERVRRHGMQLSSVSDAAAVS